MCTTRYEVILPVPQGQRYRDVSCMTPTTGVCLRKYETWEGRRQASERGVRCLDLFRKTRGRSLVKTQLIMKAERDTVRFGSTQTTGRSSRSRYVDLSRQPGPVRDLCSTNSFYYYLLPECPLFTGETLGITRWSTPEKIHLGFKL